MKAKLFVMIITACLTGMFASGAMAQETPASTEAARPETYSLTVNTTPRRTMIRILNIGPRYSPGMQLPPGEYVVEVSRNGYGTVRKVVPVIDSDVTVDIELPTPDEFYRLTVQTSPPGADIRILNIRPRYEDGMKLPPGKYHIQVSKPGYLTTSKWITHADRDRMIYVALEKKGGEQQ